MTTTTPGHAARLDDDARTPGRRPRGRRLAPGVVAAALGLGLLAGCGSSSTTTSSTTTASSVASTTTSTTGGTTTDDTGDNGSSSGSSGSSGDTSGFLSEIHTQSHFTGLSDSDLTTLGNDVCEDFQQGASLSAVEGDAVKAINEINSNDAESGENPGGNLTDHDAGFLIGAAVVHLCPEYRDKIPNS